MANVQEHESRTAKKPFVYLVGAGPGDPGLLTLRGRECLEQADFVLYDQLISPQILAYIPTTAERVSVRELAATHPERWPHIHIKLIEEARQGKYVVRLKGGDPLIFGRGGEEAQALREAGIPFEIVPGVTAALAAGAYLEVPLTHRTHASAVAFITGHEHPGKPATKIDWQAIAAFPGTLVIYMGFSRLDAIVPELIRQGKPADTPAIAVMRASCGEQRSVSAALEHLDEAVRQAGLTTPALVIIGSVVGLKPIQSWFEVKPLLGHRILVTRPRHQATDFVHRLEILGAIPITLPVLEIREPASWEPVDAAQEALRRGEFDWLVFTSPNGVEMFLNRLLKRGRDLRDLGSVKLAAIGTATAAKLNQYLLQADVVPTEGMDSEGLLVEMRKRVAGCRILFAQADQGRDLVKQELAATAQVQSIVVYRQAVVVDPSAPAFDLLRRGEIDDVTLTSPNIVNAFLGACDEITLNRIRRGEIRLIVNSPRSAAAVCAHNLPIPAQSANPTYEGLIDCLMKLDSHFTS